MLEHPLERGIRNVAIYPRPIKFSFHPRHLGDLFDQALYCKVFASRNPEVTSYIINCACEINTPHKYAEL